LDLVTIATFRDPYEAQLARGLLETYDISAYVAHEHHVGAYWLLSNALGGVKLQVSSDDEQAARAALAEPQPSVEAEAVESIRTDDAESLCPHCGSPDIRPHRLEVRSKALSMWVGFPFVFGRNHWCCNTCDHDWRRDARYRHLDRTFINLIGLLSLPLGWLWRAIARPARSAQRSPDGSGERRDATLKRCWNCGFEVMSGTPHCPACVAALPDLAVAPDYDGNCPRCHSAFCKADYPDGTTSVSCSHCQSHIELTHTRTLPLD
jgi:hypothetical protein